MPARRPKSQEVVKLNINCDNYHIWRMMDFPTEVNHRIMNFLPQYKQFRAVSMTWQKLLDSDEYFASRTLARGRVTAQELPIDQVTKRLETCEIKFDINTIGLIFSEEGIREYRGVINWTFLCRQQFVPLRIVDEYKSWIDFNELSRARTLDFDVLRKYDYEFDLAKVLKNAQNIPEDILAKYITDYSSTIIQFQRVSEEFIETHLQHLKPRHVCEYQRLSESFIRKHAKWVDWNYVSQYQSLSRGFIEEFSANVNWSGVSEYQFLQADFVIHHAKDVNWYAIFRCNSWDSEDIVKLIEVAPMTDALWSVLSTVQDLSEDIIRKNKNKLDWSLISLHQKISIDFLREFKQCIVWSKILQNKHIKLTREDKIEFLDVLIP